MIDMMPIQTSELCPLSTRLLPKELSHAFGIADDTFDSQDVPAPDAAATVAATGAPVSTAGLPADSNAEAQLKRKAPEQASAAVVCPATTRTAGNVQQPTASLTQSVHTAPLQTSSLLQAQSASQQQQQQQQQATSGISAGVQQQQALQATAAVVGSQLRGFPAAYISPHTLVPYGQQAVAALPHLSGALPLAMYSPADITTMMALQQQQQQQQQQHDESAEDLQARALKRPRLVWTPELHKTFEEAVRKIGINKAVPKTIMQMMSVEGLTRENVASHLQKYRLSLKKGPDGEFITTVTEGTDMSLAEAGATSMDDAAAPTAPTTDAGTAAGNDNSDAAGDSAGAGGGGAAAAAAAAGGVSSDAGTGAVAGSRGDAGTEEGSRRREAPAAAAAPVGVDITPGSERPPGGGCTAQSQPRTAAAAVAVAAATSALASDVAPDGAAKAGGGAAAAAPAAAPAVVSPSPAGVVPQGSA